MKRARQDLDNEPNMFSGWWGDDKILSSSNDGPDSIDHENTKRYQLDEHDIRQEARVEFNRQQQQQPNTSPPTVSNDDYLDLDDDVNDNGYDEDLHFIREQDPSSRQKLETADYLSTPLHAGPYSTTKKEWVRPPVVAIDTQKEDFIFQHTETTYGIEEQVPVIRIFGTTPNGNSVLFKTRSFRPYFYARIRDDEEANMIRRRLDAHLAIKTFKRDKVDENKYVISMEPVLKRSMCGYHRNEPLQVMYKITMAHPSHVKTARNALECVNRAVTERYIQTFEGNWKQFSFCAYF